MLKEIILTRISSSKDVVVNSRARKELKFVFESSEQVQEFFESWDETLHTQMQHPFTNDRIEWNALNFKMRVSYMKIKFDCIEIEKCDIVNFKCTRKETMDSEVFVYEIIVHKPTDSEIDELITNTYLKNKEENPENNDKLEYVFYETEFDRIITKSDSEE